MVSVNGVEHGSKKWRVCDDGAELERGDVFCGGGSGESDGRFNELDQVSQLGFGTEWVNGCDYDAE